MLKGWFTFFSELYREMVNNVTWASVAEVEFTLLRVILYSIIVTTVIFGIDLCLKLVVSFLLHEIF